MLKSYWDEEAMNNNSLQAAAVLAIVALITMAKADTSEHPCDSWPLHKMTVDCLMSKLSESTNYRLDDKDPNQRHEATPEKKTKDKYLLKPGSVEYEEFYPNFRQYINVRHFLAAVDDADKDAIIFGQFSVRQLRKLNNFKPGRDCTEEGLATRRATCQKFAPRREMNNEDLPERDNESGENTRDRSRKFIRFNLAKYCWHKIDNIEVRCPMERVRASIGEEAEKLLSAFHKKTDISSRFVPKSIAYNRRMLSLVVKLALSKKSHKERADIKWACYIVIEQLEQASSWKALAGDWEAAEWLKLCRIINKKIKKDAH